MRYIQSQIDDCVLPFDPLIYFSGNATVPVPIEIYCPAFLLIIRDERKQALRKIVV